MVRYYRLGKDRPLHDIVFAGSHDAGIVGGASNVQTQTLDVFGQGLVGVRLFDIRVRGSKHDPTNVAKLTTYHGTAKATEKKSILGAKGEGLTGLLRDAKRFVTDYNSEFLILKFDKCKSWDLIAQECVDVLDDTIYSSQLGNAIFGDGCVNTKTLDQLKGKVIVVFSEEGAKETNLGAAEGILQFHNVRGSTYIQDFVGLQYYGKGGTTLKPWVNKHTDNKKKQTKIMKEAALQPPDVLGMMYWTSTGIFESIQDRDRKMWSDHRNVLNKASMANLWANGLAYAIANSYNPNADPGDYNSCIPNIVMIDFAETYKCQTIYDLNDFGKDLLSQMRDEFGQAEEL